MSKERLCHLVIALVALVAPMTSNFCRFIFYEEKEPDGLRDFINDL